MSLIYKKRLIISTIALLMSGCASTQQTVVDADAVAISEQLERTLATLAEKAVEAKQITQSHQAAMARLNPDVKGYKPIIETPINLDTHIPMEQYFGDALEPLKLISQMTNYDLKIGNTLPQTEIFWVRLHSMYTRTAIDLLDDIANQVDNRGLDIDVWETPGEKHYGVIMLNYRGVQQ